MVIKLMVQKTLFLCSRENCSQLSPSMESSLHLHLSKSVSVDVSSILYRGYSRSEVRSYITLSAPGLSETWLYSLTNYCMYCHIYIPSKAFYRSYSSHSIYVLLPLVHLLDLVWVAVQANHPNNHRVIYLCLLGL